MDSASLVLADVVDMSEASFETPRLSGSLASGGLLGLRVQSVCPWLWYDHFQDVTPGLAPRLPSGPLAGSPHLAPRRVSASSEVSPHPRGQLPVRLRAFPVAP